ncbi:MAG TPA: DUF4397 domain-containing protein [Microbacterium sp.]|nr:DUF4397 domain-containing protein [Microbacterium sp.]
MKLSSSQTARLVAALAVAATAGVLMTPVAAEGTTAPGLGSAATAQDGGWLRLGHFSADTVAVDVRVSALSGGTVVLEVQDVGYGDISGYQPLAPGGYAISMIPTGSGDWSKLAVSDSVTIDAATATTVAAYGPADDLQVRAFTDDLTPPSAGNARVRLFQASTVSSTVDVETTTGVVIAEDAASGTPSAYAEVPAGSWTLELTGSNGTGQSDVEVAAGTVMTLFVLDTADGGLTVIPVVDSAGAPLVPYGGVDTGGGWLAHARASALGSAHQHATARGGAVAF